MWETIFFFSFHHQNCCEAVSKSNHLYLNKWSKKNAGVPVVTSVVCLWPLWCSFNRDNYFKLGHSAVIAAPLHGQTEQLLKWWEQAFAKKDDEIKLEIGKGEGRTSQQSVSNSSSRSFSKREASISKISQDWVCILALCWQAEKNWLKAPRNTVLLRCVLCLCMQYC